MKENRFEIPPLSPDKAKSYWDTIHKKGLTAYYGEYPAQIGHPIEIESSFAGQIAEGAKATHGILLDEIKRAGGITALMADRPVTFGPHNLNKPEINNQLEERLDRGYGLPLIYDVLVTREKGKQEVKVLEIQTGIGYETVLSEWLQAAGYQKDAPQTRFSKESPATRYGSFSERFANNEPIVVMDTDALALNSITLADKVGMQKLVGGAHDIPISPLDIAGKDEHGYYYHPYLADPEQPFDAKRDSSGQPIKDMGKKKYAKHILTRMGQPDLDILWDSVKDNKEKADFIAQFLTDAEVNWIFHPVWPHIGDKSLLPGIRKQLLDKKNPLAKQFVPIYGSGDIIDEPGGYIVKPTNEASGNNHSFVHVQDTAVTVEDGFVYQKLITPSPIVSFLPGKYASALRRDTQQIPKDTEQSRPITGQLEIRCLIHPYWDQESDIVGRYMARYAPRWTNPTSSLTTEGERLNARTKTNILPIYEALHAHLDPIQKGEDYRFYPYGFAPVVLT